jgi:glucose-1-phosphate cytidylyltransferase
MQVAILCGGLGTRLSEETVYRPKPMVEIGRRPILWHIMRFYRHFGHDRFVLCTGYKGDMIKQFFLDYRQQSHDLLVDLDKSSVTELDGPDDRLDWKVVIQDTGIATQTASRLKKAMRYVEGDLFLATYGDGLCNVDLDALVEHHHASGKLATVTAVRPSSRFGELGLNGDSVTSFAEKPQTGQGWINGGFFVFHRSIFERLSDDPGITLEADVLQPLAEEGQLAVYRHNGFWQCMDTVRELQLLEEYWQEDSAPWKMWA